MSAPGKMPIEEKTSSGWAIIVLDQSVPPDQKVQKLNGNTSSGKNGVQVTKRVLYVAVAVLAALLLVTIATILWTRQEEPTPVPPTNNGDVVSVLNNTKSDHQPPLVHGSHNHGIYRNSTVDVNENGTLVIVSRQAWGALPSKDAHTLLKLPVPYVIISHSASEQCNHVSLCVELVKNFQEFHMNGRKWDDIGYNFLVGGDGFAYEGRGWDYVGAHAYGYDKRSIGLNFIGTFTSELPPKRQILAAKQLIEKGVELGKIDSNYKLLAHAQVSSTQSPGLWLFVELKTWPHWSETP